MSGMDRPTCLVTGAAGFIGSHLCERLLDDGNGVIGIDCFTDYYPRAYKESNLEGLLGRSGFRFIEDDLRRTDLYALLEGVSYVFHQAAQAGVRASWGESFDIYTDLNILATQKLLEAARQSSAVQKFVCASSSSVYGDSPELPLHESGPVAPVSPYGVTKLAAEHLARLYAANFGLPTVSLRYFTVYGPRQRPDMAFHKFLRAIYAGQPIPLYGDGEQTRDFTFVDNVVEANLRALTADPEKVGGAVMNVACGERTSLLELLSAICEITGRRAEPVFAPARQGDVRDSLAAIAEAEQRLGFTPAVSLREGLSRTIDWFRNIEQGDRR